MRLWPTGLRPPRLVVAAAVAFAALGCLYAQVAPLAEGMDEPAHADLVFHQAAGGDHPSYDERQVGLGVEAFCRDHIAARWMCAVDGEPDDRRRFEAGDAPRRSDRPSFQAYGGDEEGDELNQLAHHPSLYYDVAGAALRAERALTGDTTSMEQEWASVRLLNAVALGPLPVLAWVAVKRLGGQDRTALVASLLPFSIPQLLHAGATIGGDSLFALASAVVVAAGCGVLRGDRSKRTALVLGAALGVALLAKAFALALVPFVAAAYLFRSTSARSLARATLALASASVVGGWWYVRNLVRDGELSPTAGERIFAVDGSPATSLVTFTHAFGSKLTWRTFGEFGFYTSSISRWSIAGLLLVHLAAATALVVALRRRRAGASGSDEDQPSLTVGDAVILLVPAVITLAFVFRHAWTLHRRSGAFPFIQGRYLYGTLVSWWVLLADGIVRLARRLALPLTAVLVLVVQGDALHRQSAAYWGPVGSGVLDQVRAASAWNAWPPAAQAGGVTAALLTLGWLAAEVARGTREQGPRSVRSPE